MEGRRLSANGNTLPHLFAYLVIIFTVMGPSSSLAPILPIRPSPLQIDPLPRTDGNRPGRSWPLLGRDSMMDGVMNLASG